MSELCSVSVNTGLFTVITVSCEPLSQSTKVQDILEKYGSHVQAFACINPMLQANLRRPDGELKCWERLHEDLVEDGLYPFIDRSLNVIQLPKARLRHLKTAW